MKTILAHLEISPVLDSVLRCTWLTAERFGSYIEGLHMRPGQPDVIAAGADGFVAAAPDLIAGFEKESRERAERARVLFEDFMQRQGLPRGIGDDPARPSADWRVETSTGPSLIGSVGRVFDLIVVGRPLDDAVAPSMAALETALFETGRVLLIAPPKAPERLGEMVVVAWNGSSETARTVAFAMPFIKRAREVVVLSVQKGMVPGPSAGELAHNLRRHGLKVEWKDVPGSDPRVAGEAILTEAAALGADLLVKGAYTQSRLRQMIFGGPTSHILSAAELPVFFAH
jgi:nucleotide-binding universal stress UspA family protein